jgi:hypothetical protein
MSVNRTRWTLPFAMAALLLVAQTTWATDEALRDPATVLPQDTILLAKLAPWQEWSKAWDQTSLSKIGGEAELKAFLSGPLNRLQELLSGKAAAPADAAQPSAVASFCKALGDLAPGPIVVAMCYSEQDVAA